MTKTLRVSDSLSLPPDTVTSTLIVYGGKGMGKSVFGSVLAEELAGARLRWSFLDPLGVNWGIRHAADGNGPGVECLIMGGVHGDVPIEPAGGAAVADIVVEESGNVLVDFSRSKNGETWGVGEKIRFATAYGRRLFQRQGSLIDGRKREPLMQILDEGARFIPQIIPAGNPDLAMCVSAWQQFAEEGRNVGLGLCVLTQRSARMNKDIAELADAMIAFRTIGPNSVGAVLDWLGEHVEKARVKELSEQVRKLPRGSALVVSPGWLEIEKVVPMRMRRTFDSSATPKPGERPRTARGEGAKPDLERIRARMAETIERAKADDPKELRKRIADLEKELRAKVAAPIEIPKEVRVEVPMFDREAFDEVLRGLTEQYRTASEAAQLAVNNVRGILHTYSSKCHESAGAKPGSSIGASRPVRAASPPRPPRALRDLYADATPESRARRDPKPSNGAPTPLPAGERVVLTAIAQHPDGVTREQLTILTGYKRSTRDSYIQRMGQAGSVEQRGDRIFATDDGLERLGGFEPLPTGRALLEHWLGELPDGESKVLSVVAGAYPNAVHRSEIDERTGFKRSTRDSYLQRLGARRLVVTEGSGNVALAQGLDG